MIDPIRYFEVKGQVCPLLAVANAAIAVANNTQIIAAIPAVAGVSAAKVIRVMGWSLQSTGAGFPSILFKSNSAGTALTAPIFIPSNAAGLSDRLPIIDTGYFETSAGHGLFVDVTVATINSTIFYITYTP